MSASATTGRWGGVDDLELATPGVHRFNHNRMYFMIRRL